MQRKRRLGISLVVLMISIVVGVAIVTTVTIAAGNNIEKAKIGKFTNKISQVQDAVNSYYLANNELPSSTETLTVEEVTSMVKEENKAIFQSELVLNGDNQANFYKVDFDKIDVDGKKEDLNFVYSYPNMKVYDLNGLKQDDEVYYSISSKINNIKTLENEKNQDSSTTSNSKVEITKTSSLTVTSNKEVNTNKLGVKILTTRSAEETLMLYFSNIASGKEIKSGINEVSFDTLDELNASSLLVNNISQSEIDSFNQASDRTITVVLLKDAKEIAKEVCEFKNYDVLSPDISFVNERNYENMKVLRFNVSDLGSGVKEIRYDYLEQFNSSLNKSNYYENISSFDEEYMKTKAKVLNASSIVNNQIEIKVPNDVASVYVMAVDNAGNVSDILPFSYTYDVICTITADKTSPTSSNVITYTFTFSKEVVGFSSDDISVTNGVKGEFTGTGKVYKLVVTDGVTGVQKVEIADGVCSDGNGNSNLKATKEITIDKVAPTISNITVTSPTSGTYKAEQVIEFKVTYSKNIYADTNKSSITSSNAPILKVKFGSGEERVATFNSSSGNYIIYKYTIQDGDNGILSTKELSGRVYDNLGNELILNNITITGNEIVADTIRPSLEIIATPSENPTKATSITYTFKFSEPVKDFSISDINVTNGTVGTFTKIDSSNYTLVVTNDNNYIQTISVADNVCTDIVGNLNTGSTKKVQIDRVVPELTGFVISSPVSGVYRANQTITIKAKFSKNVYSDAAKGSVTASNAPKLYLDFGNAGTSKLCTFSSVSSTEITYTYVIANGDNGALSIKSYGENSLYDHYGDKFALTNKTLTGSSIVADTSAPTIISLTQDATTWTNNNVTLTAKAKDTGTGIIGYQFSDDGNLDLNSGGWTNITATINEIIQTFEVSSNNTYYFYVKDASGNISKEEIVVDKIDKTNPNPPTKLSYDVSYNSITVKATGGSDDFGEFSTYQYSLDNISWQDSNVFSNILSGTEKTVYVRSVDKATNVSTNLVGQAKTLELGQVTLTPSTLEKTAHDVEIEISHGAVPGYVLQYKKGDGSWTDYTSKIAIETNMKVSGRLFNKTLSDVGNSENSIDISNIDKTNYLVTYNLDGGTVESNPSTYTVEDTFTLNNPTKEGYTFTGWTGSNGDTPSTTVTITKGSTGNKTYTANWSINSYYIDLNIVLDGTTKGTGDSRIKVGLKIGGVDKGYVQDFWELYPYNTTWEIYGFNLNGTNVAYSQTGILGAKTLSIEPKFNTVTIGVNNADYGSVSSTSLIVVNGTTYTTNGNKLTLSDNRNITASTKTITGYTLTFKDWTPSSGTITSATEITANFEKQANTYSVIYNGNGSTGGSTATSTHIYDVKKALTANGYERKYTVTYNHNYTGSTNKVETASYTFNGWNTASNGSGTSYADKAEVKNLVSSGSITLYAKWTPVELTYVPTRTGYTFEGWYTDSGCTNKVADNTGIYTVDSNITLYAKWTPITYTITYNLNGGSVGTANKTSYTIETASFTLNNPSKSGYTFVGWNGTGLSSTTKSVTIAKGSIGNKTYTASWSKVTLDKTSVTLDLSGTKTVKLIATGDNAGTLSWSSSNTSIATVDSSGNVTGVANGSATITVRGSNGGPTATCTVTVQTSPTGVTLNKTSYTLDLSGTKTLQLTATVSSGANVSTALTWSSSNTSVATVSTSGLVTAVANGTAVVTVKTANNKSATCTITVQTSPTAIAISGATYVRVGKTTTYTISSYTPSTANANKNVTWSSSNTAVATISSSGVITGIKAGTATITAKTANGVTATKTITVTSLSITPSSKVLELSDVKTVTLTASGSNYGTVTWSTSNSSIAKISATTGTSITVTGLAIGSCTITATGSNGSITATCSITVRDSYVLNVSTGTYYSSLQAAIGAASSGNKLKLLKHISMGTTTLTFDKNIELDGNSKTISGSGTNVIKNTATLNTSNVTINSTNTSSSYAINNTGTLNLNAGTVLTSSYSGITSSNKLNITGATVNAQKDAIYQSNGTLTVNSGTITATDWSGISVYSGTVTVLGGTVKGKNSGIYCNSSATSCTLGNSSSTPPSVTSPEIIGTNTGIQILGGKPLYFYDGKITSTATTPKPIDATSITTQSGYGILYSDSNQTATLTSTNNIVATNISVTPNRNYTNLQTAIDSATSGNTIQLKKTITVSSSIISSPSRNASGSLNSITLNLNGCNITAGSTYAITSSNNLTITGSGTISSTGNTVINNTGTLTINSGVTVDGPSTSGKYGIYNTSGTIYIKGGTVTSGDGIKMSGGTLEMSSGTINSKADDAIEYTSGNVTIKGGNITGKYGIWRS